MSWRDARARVDSGFYKQKEKSGFETGFTKAADIIASSWIKTAADEKEEKKRVDAENRAERKRIRASQEKADAVAKKNKKNAAILAETFTGSSSNVQAVTYFQNQLSLMDGDVGSVMTSTQNMVDSDRIEFTAPSTETVSTPYQGPNVPVDPKIEDLGVGFGSDGKVETGPDVDPLGTTSQTKKPFRTSDVDKIAADENNEYSVQAKEMQEIFAERGTPLDGTTLPEDGTEEVTTEGGVKITPYGQQPDKLDYSRLDNLENMKLYLLEIKNGDINLSASDTAVVEKQLEGASDAALMGTVMSIINDPDAAKAMNDTNLALGVESAEATIVKSIVEGQVKNAKPWEEFLSPATIAAASDVKTLETFARMAKSMKAPDEALVLVKAEIKARQEREKTDRAWITDATQSKDKAFAAIQLYTQNGDEANRKIAESIYVSYENKDPAYASLLEVSSLLGKTSAELSEIRSGAVSLGATSESLEFIDKTMIAAKRVENLSIARKYISEATSFAKTQAQIQLAEAESAPQEVIDRLTGLAMSQQKADLEESLAQSGVVGAIAIDAVYNDPTTGKLGYGVLMALPDGTTQTPDGTVVTGSRAMSELESKRFESIAVQTNKYFMEASTSGVAIAEGLRGAENLLTIAREENRVRNFSGDLAQNLTNFVRGGTGVYDVLKSLFDGGATSVTEDQLRAAVGAAGGSSEGMVDAIISGDVQNLASKTAQFEAGMLALVFRSGKMEGQSGNAMSNKDFDRLQTMLNVEGDFAAFEATLRRYMADKIKSYDLKGQTLLDGAVGTFQEQYKYLPVKSPLTFSEVVGRNGDPELQAAYDSTVGFSPEVVATAPEPVPNQLEAFENNNEVTLLFYSEGSTDPVPVPFSKERFVKGLNDINLLYENGNIDEATRVSRRTKAITQMAEALGTTYERLLKMGNY